MTAATPRSWRTGIGRFGLGSLAAAAPGLLLAEVYPEGSGNRIFAERHEDAALIVRAVNAHDALVAALRALVTDCIELAGGGQGWCVICGEDNDSHAEKCSISKAEALLRALDAAAPAGSHQHRFDVVIRDDEYQRLLGCSNQPLLDGTQCPESYQWDR